jgi:hypothetical protein
MRIVCQFSCGAASAVATKLTLAEYPPAQVEIVNAFIAEEHPDNRRFLADCERWFEHPITVLRDQKYGASAREVWRQKRFMKGPFGAPCSMILKRELIAAFLNIGDRLVFGFTAEEEDRAHKFLMVGHLCPLIDRNLSKADCLAIIERAGIELPWNYRVGLNNANCLGCPKGGEGYWNFIRVIAPEVFEETTQIQEQIGPGTYFFRNRKTGERFGLRQLHPEAGRHDRTVPDCSFFCAMAEEEMQ